MFSCNLIVGMKFVCFFIVWKLYAMFFKVVQVLLLLQRVTGVVFVVEHFDNFALPEHIWERSESWYKTFQSFSFYLFQDLKLIKVCLSFYIFVTNIFIFLKWEFIFYLEHQSTRIRNLLSLQPVLHCFNSKRILFEICIWLYCL